MKVINESSKTTECVPSVNVTWLNWKAMLGHYFTFPQKCYISQYHEFRFDPDIPGVKK